MIKMIRIPKDIADELSIDSGLDSELMLYVYDNGQSRVSFRSNGPRDYFLWSVKRQCRIREWKTAREMWDYLRDCLALGDDKYGLVQLAE